jgi:hypothetical protein
VRREVLAFIDQDQALLETASANSIVSIVPTPKRCDSTVPNQHYPLQNITNPQLNSTLYYTNALFDEYNSLKNKTK